MKANEIRISNLIQWEDESEEIISIKSIIHDSDDDYLVKFAGGSAQLAEFKPIPLTEEWLLKFGFEKLTKRFRKEVNGYWYTVWDSGQFDVDNKAISFNCKYVHQLQNLYFDLTGEDIKY